jgi:probable HAF family extracellular repeat protein
MSRLRALWIVLVAALVTCPIASGATYTVTDLGTLGGTRSYAAAINTRGDVVGWSTLAGDTAVHAFLYESRRGRMIDLDPRGAAASSRAWGINDRGRIAGAISAAGVTQRTPHSSSLAASSTWERRRALRVRQRAPSITQGTR